tara:strand:- start:1144 stop:2214 length:1071 start_codon:yes stop_codon:yes gene_type:complete
MRPILIILLLLFQSNSFAEVQENNDTIDYARTGDYFPYVPLTDKDSLYYPITYEIELFVNDLYDLDIQNNFFTAEITAGIYSDYDSIFTSVNGDVFPLYPYDYISMETKEALEGYVDSWYYWGYDPDPKYESFAYELNYKNVFNHKWNLREYPFDRQYLKIEFITPRDTSFVTIKQSESFPPSFNKYMDNFRDGYKILDITSETSYFETPYEAEFAPDEIRKEVGTKVTFKILVDRSGSYLFLKLFGGSLFAFIISWLTFFIPRKEFDSRISLNIGAIFGAIGNRYFVDSSLANIQVMTKSDIINYICIILLILNIILIIVQRNNKITWPFLEKSTNALIFSAALFITLIAIVILW